MKKVNGITKEQRDKLRKEYEGWGGAENKALPSNLFLNIMVGISAAAIICKLTGILG